MIKKKTILFYGTHDECLEWPKYNPKRHDVLKDESRDGEWIVLNKSVDRTIRKPITRVARDNYKHYRKPIMVSLLPGDMIQMKLKGQRAEGAKYRETLEDVYRWMAQRAGLRAIAAKKAAKAARKKARATKR